MSYSIQFENAMSNMVDAFIELVEQQVKWNRKIGSVAEQNQHALHEVPMEKMIMILARRVVDDPRYPKDGQPLEVWIAMLRQVMDLRKNGGLART